MASLVEKNKMPLNDPNLTELWIRTFEAHVRTRKLKDEKDSANEITDLFLATAGIEAIGKVSIMAQPNELEMMTFSEIKKIILEAIRPKKKLIVAERTHFMSMRQNNNEKSQEYLQRLRTGARYCEFQKLGCTEAIQSAEDDLIMMRFIDGLINPQYKLKLMEQIQIIDGSMDLTKCSQFVQQMEIIHDFNSDKNGIPSITNVCYNDKNKYKPVIAEHKSCQFCGNHHEKRNCPAYGKVCSKCQRKNHFAKVCRSKSMSSHLVDSNNRDDEYNNTNSNDHDQNKYNNNNECVESRIYNVEARVNNVKDSMHNSTLRHIRINDKMLQMQIDTGSQATIIPYNFWTKLNKPKLQRTYVKLTQFDGSVIEMLGKFTATIETESKFKTIEIIVTKCEKSHGLIGTDVLKIDSMELNIQEATKAMSTNEEESIGCLKGFKTFYYYGKT
jgi:hypothetical protein